MTFEWDVFSVQQQLIRRDRNRWLTWGMWSLVNSAQGLASPSFHNTVQRKWFIQQCNRGASLPTDTGATAHIPAFSYHCSALPLNSCLNSEQLLLSNCSICKPVIIRLFWSYSYFTGSRADQWIQNKLWKSLDCYVWSLKCPLTLTLSFFNSVITQGEFAWLCTRKRKGNLIVKYFSFTLRSSEVKTV